MPAVPSTQTAAPGAASANANALPNAKRGSRLLRLSVLTLSALLVSSVLLTGLAGAAPAANPAYNLDQCANGKLGPPVNHVSPCEWVNGNLNSAKSHYTEGES